MRITDDGEGVSRLSGIDEQGNRWIQFEVDAFAEQEAGTCCMCDKDIESGWLCLDGGDEMCDRHVDFFPTDDDE